MGDRGEETESWPRGEVIVVRHVRWGRVVHAEAAIVVEDRPERLVLFTPLGSDMRQCKVDWETGENLGPFPQRRHTTDALTILTPGAAHAVVAMFHGGGGPFICWYVNLQEPFRRAADGIITNDQQLDVVIGPDLRWRWKDEDHLARIVELGWIDALQAKAIRMEGEAVLETLKRGGRPFNEPWPQWRADPDWVAPDLPADWDRVPEFA